MQQHDTPTTFLSNELRCHDFHVNRKLSRTQKLTLKEDIFMIKVPPNINYTSIHRHEHSFMISHVPDVDTRKFVSLCVACITVWFLTALEIDLALFKSSKM